MWRILMKMFFYGLLILLACLSLEVNAQFKSSEQQYLSEENLAINGGFEQGKKNWTNANGTFSIDSSFKVLGNSSGKVQLTAQTLDFSQTLTTGYNASLSGLQGQVSAYVKANFAFEVCALIDGAESNCLQGNTDNSFDFYQIPIVLGATSLGIKFKSIGAVTGTIYVDGVSYGHKQFVQDIAQAELAFDVNIGGSSSPTISATYSSYTEITNASLDMVVNKGSNLEIPCSGTNPSTGLTCSVGSESIGVVFDAKVGIYEICASFATFTNAGVYGSYTAFQLVETPNNAQTILQEGNTRLQNGANMSVSPNNATTQALTNCGVFEFTSAGKKTIRLMLEKPNSITTTLLLDRSSTTGQRDMHITGKYYPPKSKIVANLQEETVKTANEFSFKVNTIDGVVISQNLDWINNCTTAGTGTINCTFNSGIFTEPPACSAVVENALNDYNTIINNLSTNGFGLRTAQNVSTGNTTPSPAQVGVHCQKQGADYNKSRMIVGKFKEVPTAPNTTSMKICYYAFGGAGSLTSPSVCNVSPCIEYYDSCGTASPPNRAVVGNYRSNGVVWSSGTWKPNTPMYCSCETQESGVGNHLACDIRRTLVFASDSSGGYYVDPFTYTFAGTSQDGVVTIKCEGEAP